MYQTSGPSLLLSWLALTTTKRGDAFPPIDGYAKEFDASGRYIGHFVGIAVHDVIDIVGGAARKAFVPGTVFNVEPILEIPDRKIHIRLEDTIVVTDTGADNLTAAVPAEVEPLYALIRRKGVNSAPLADRTSR